MSDTAPILDACCGSRMFWFNRADQRAIFADKRRESHVLPDKSSRGGSRTLEVNPDVLADFTALPWPLVGQRCGKSAKTHWMVFMKSATGVTK